MKTLIAMILLQVILYPTIPGSRTYRDLTAPRIVIDGDRAYQTIPGSNFWDYTKPSYRIERNDAAYPMQQNMLTIDPYHVTPFDYETGFIK